jgi:hypothetical protein
MGAFFLTVLLPIFMLVLGGVLDVVPRVEPHGANYAGLSDAYQTIIGGLVVATQLPVVYSYLIWKKEVAR